MTYVDPANGASSCFPLPGSPYSPRHSTEQPPLRWWQTAVFYEIAPISFQDSNGDGKGDLPGVLSRLDYLEWLGVQAVWLTPIYPSPMLDFGYDITDFCDVNPLFGTLEDFDRLVEGLHRRDIRLILDFVPNHTSDRHPWFLQSRSSKTNSKRDWYVWSDAGSDGGPPNNWLSRFGGSAWEWNEPTEQYYYHAFLLEQPDLNWRNEEVRAAMCDVLRFWLRRGADGFRVDASAVLAEDELLRDDPPNPSCTEKTPPPQRLTRIFTDDRRESMPYLEEIRAALDEFQDRALAGEVQGKTDRIGHFYGESRPRLHLPLNFVLHDTPWDALSLQAKIDAYVNAIQDEGWPNWVIGGHDKSRMAGKIGQAQCRVLAMLLLTLKGTPFLYAGDELGMEPVSIPPELVQDPFEKLLAGYGLNRDPERTPMRWDGTPRAGFTAGEPWLPIGGGIQRRNVEALQADDQSLLHLYRHLLRFRREHQALVDGDYVPMRSRNDVVLFQRRGRNETLLIALNTLHQPRMFPWDGSGMVMLSTYLDGPGYPVKGPWRLRADEGLIIRTGDA